ncbi:MAG: HlyD family type I secretion periplasmic adaptor subunit [Pseudomonadota bacterium]
MADKIDKLPVALRDLSPRGSAVRADPGLRLRLAISLLIVAVLIFGVGGWAATAQLAGAIIAPGLIMVDSNIKKVQHPTGGVIGEILVRNGDRVTAGQFVVRFDDTQTRASLGAVVSQITELTGRRARLVAERDGVSTITFPEGFEGESKHANAVASGERRFLASRLAAIAGQKQQLDERVGQLREEIRGLDAQRHSKLTELELIEEEQSRIQGLYDMKLTPITRLLSMKREVTRVGGEHGALVARIARAKGQISETKLQIISIDQRVQSEAQKEIREIEGRMAELMERETAARDQLKRIDVRAPRAGLVHDLRIHTVGGVVSPGDAMMSIVPSEDLLTIEARVPPADIDQVRVGQLARLRFSAFNQRTTPEVESRVVRVGADLSRDETTGDSFYKIRLRADREVVAALGNLKLVPGMPVEVFVQTGARSTLAYLAKPITDYFSRAFREE